MAKNGYVAPFAERDNFQANNFSAPAIDVLEHKVRFSLKYCDTARGYCISNVTSDKRVLKDLYKRLGHFEDMTWQSAKELPRENGISVEKRDSANYRDMSSSFTDFSTFGHLRVQSVAKPTFRVFGALREDLFYILRFDVNGSLNH